MKRLLTGLSLLVAGVICTMAWLGWEIREFSETALRVPEQGVVVFYPPGTPVSRIAGDLAQRGIMEDALYWRLLIRWRGDAPRIKAGEYRLEPGTTPNSLIDQLVKGAVIQHSLTLVEGWTFRQWLRAIAENEVIEHTVEGLSGAEIMRRLGSAVEHPEGQFLADTYFLTRGSTDIALLKRSYRAMQGFVAEVWPDREPGLPLKTPYDALILASIVEKETGLASERPDIAGVFVRRLHKGMRLQTDPTVIYGMGDRFDGNIRRRDLQEDTPYNTYVHAGLPPTPISMPGREAILAVLHPAADGSLYFVARGDGSHQFSETLREHNRAVRKFQLNR